MKPYYEQDGMQIFLGDCREALTVLADCSVDSIVTDPPYELGFMGKGWDRSGIAYDVSVWRECLRVLKPGGHLLAFGGSRTYHRLACAIEDAGFEIRDQIQWIYGSGFPKSLDVSKAIDSIAPRVAMFQEFAAHYAERRAALGLTHNAICAAGKFHGEHNHGGASVNWEKGSNVPTLAQWGILQPLLNLSDEYSPLIDRIEAERQTTGSGQSGATAIWNTQGGMGNFDITQPATDAAKQWNGWGTALKPAHEPIVLARKPLGGTVAENVLKYGTGGLNIDGCRVDGAKGNGNWRGACDQRPEDVYEGGWGEQRTEQNQLGRRWPANVITDGSEEVLAAFPNAPGQQGDLSGHSRDRLSKGIFGDMKAARDAFARLDSGSAARFFYAAKASQEDRNEGCEGMEFRVADTTHKRPRTELDDPRRAGVTLRQNNHPTVKPTDLMRYLCRLVTPPNGIVLDPFCGSGSTGKAAMLEGLSFIGIELSAEYCELAEKRIAAVMKQGRLMFA